MCAMQIGPGVYDFEAADIKPDALLFEYSVAGHGAPDATSSFYCICQDVSAVAAVCGDVLRAHLEAGYLDLEAYADYLRSGVFPGAEGASLIDAELVDRWTEHLAGRLHALHRVYVHAPKPETLAQVVELIQAYNFGDVSWIERLDAYVDDSQDYLLDRLAALNEEKGLKLTAAALRVPGDEEMLARLFTFLNESA
jgi:hypothetical protein